MDLELLKRRTEMLDTVCKGFHPSAVIAQMAEKYKVSERCLWSDWERREKWVPMLLSLEKYAEFADEVETKLNTVQKAAWSTYMRTSNDSARVGALKIVLEFGASQQRGFVKEYSAAARTCGGAGRKEVFGGKESVRVYREADRRLKFVEKKLAAKHQDMEEQTQIDSDLLLQSYEYLRKQEEITMMPEEIQKNSTQTLQQILEWYNAYSELSIEEQKRQNKIRAAETAKGLEQFRAWLKSTERKQFDTDYANRHQKPDQTYLKQSTTKVPPNITHN